MSRLSSRSLAAVGAGAFAVALTVGGRRANVRAGRDHAGSQGWVAHFVDGISRR